MSRVVLMGIAALLVAGVVLLRFGSTSAFWFLFGLISTWCAVPFVSRFAHRVSATVLPGGRAIHTAPTPLLGGLAVFAPMAAYLALDPAPGASALLAGGALMAMVGAFDDVFGVSPRSKILAQLLAGVFLVVGGIRTPMLELAPLGTFQIGSLEWILVPLWVVIVTNAVNLIDGMDGLAASLALIAAAAATAMGLGGLTPFVLAGALFGFLRYNLPRAGIFLGDTGSLTIGFYLGAFMLQSSSAAVNVPLALGLLAVPLGDVLCSTVRRWSCGKPIFSADRGHIHHLLRHQLGSDGAALRALIALAASQAAAVVIWPNLFGLAVVGAMGLVVVGLLIARSGYPWKSHLLNRKSFRRIHLVRRYATDSLRLADHTDQVSSVMEHVAQDLDLSAIRLAGIRVERPQPGRLQVEEHVDCGNATASWSASFTDEDPVVAEEKRNVLCDLLRLATARVGAMRSVAAESATPDTRPLPTLSPANPALPRVHFIVDGEAQLAAVSSLVRETRERATLEPVVVHVGRRDDLGLTDAEIVSRGYELPVVDLDVAATSNIVRMAHVMERYHSLATTHTPSVVVVGSSRAGAACALAAKELGVPVAHIGAPESALTHAMSDLSLTRGIPVAQEPGARESQQLVFLDEGALPAEGSLVPALEALLVAN